MACGSFRIEIVGSETPLQSRLEEDVFAEVAATNMAIVKAMGLLASVATDRRPHLSADSHDGRDDGVDLLGRSLLVRLFIAGRILADADV